MTTQEATANAAARSRTERVGVERSVPVRVQQWPGLEAFCIDIKEEGIRLELADAVAIGDRLEFEVALSPAHPTRLVAEVRDVTESWGHGHVVDLRWLTPEDTDATAVSHQLAEAWTETDRAA